MVYIQHEIKCNFTLQCVRTKTPMHPVVQYVFKCWCKAVADPGWAVPPPLELKLQDLESKAILTFL